MVHRMPCRAARSPATPEPRRPLRIKPVPAARRTHCLSLFSPHQPPPATLHQAAGPPLAPPRAHCCQAAFPTHTPCSTPPPRPKASARSSLAVVGPSGALCARMRVGGGAPRFVRSAAVGGSYGFGLPHPPNPSPIPLPLPRRQQAAMLRCRRSSALALAGLVLVMAGTAHAACTGESRALRLLARGACGGSRGG